MLFDPKELNCVRQPAVSYTSYNTGLGDRSSELSVSGLLRRQQELCPQGLAKQPLNGKIGR